MRAPESQATCANHRQQAQVDRIAEPWRAFVAAWPTPAALAKASTRDLLRAWAGLGYNRRALALRDAAVAIVQRHAGDVPADVAALVDLPGIGPYTARAVAATAFGLPVAPLDVNARRVVSRVLGDALPPRELQDAADRAAASVDSAAWTHAVMDLAVLRCTRRAPRCGECPIGRWCASRGTAGDPPRRAVRRDPAATSQPPFEVTRRWLRGRIVARLRDAEPGTWVAFDGAIGRHPEAAVRDAVEALASEGLVEVRGSGARLR